MSGQDNPFDGKPHVFQTIIKNNSVHEIWVDGKNHFDLNEHEIYRSRSYIKRDQATKIHKYSDVF